MKVLIIEDKEPLTEEYLRIFRRILGEPIIGNKPVQFTCVHDIESSVVSLTSGDWDIIFVDFELGPPVILHAESSEEEDQKISNGCELVSYQRALEKTKESRSTIIGISPHHVGNEKLLQAGADKAVLKLEIPKMADFIKKAYIKKAELRLMTK